VPAIQQRDRGDVVLDGPVRQQPGLLDHVADTPPQRRRPGLRHVAPVQQDPDPVSSISQLTMRRVVVLPQPLGPTRIMIFPSGTSRPGSDHRP
jgi:hypothetical protein